MRMNVKSNLLCCDSDIVIVSQYLYLSFINEAEKSCDVIKRGENYFEKLHCT